MKKFTWKPVVCSIIVLGILGVWYFINLSWLAPHEKVASFKSAYEGVTTHYQYIANAPDQTDLDTAIEKFITACEKSIDDRKKQGADSYAYVIKIGEKSIEKSCREFFEFLAGKTNDTSCMLWGNIPGQEKSICLDKIQERILK